MSVKKPIQVLIVDDSKVSQELLAYVVRSDPDLQVMGIVDSGNAALNFLEQHKPDVITMDIVMPNMDGFEATRRIIQRYPVPIVVISSMYNSADIENSFKAIEAGALAILPKPMGINDQLFTDEAKSITDTIKMMSEVKVVTRRFPQKNHGEASLRKLYPSYPKLDEEDKMRCIDAVAIGASLGGPQALNELLSQLPATFPVPIFVVQHIAQGFVQGFVDWLNSSSALQICLAKNGEEGKPGHVYIAPDKFHMEVQKGNRINLIDAPPEGGCRPSVARLFRSMAKVHRQHGVGIILTGMGKDGVEDLLKMKEVGALTIAQHKESCIMYGMPEEAVQIGAAKRVLHLSDIASSLIFLAESSLRQKKG